MNQARKHTIRLVVLSIVLLLTVVGCGHQEPPSSQMVLPIASFEVADDVLRNMELQAEGGLRGRVLRVTTLAPSGPGSLRDALEADGPRLVVFEVGGVIRLNGETLVIRHPDVTAAGQTGPDPGITLIRGSLAVETHDVVIEHLAVRPGDGKRKRFTGDWSPDAMGTRRSSGGPVYNVVFDHCSATWAIDENLFASGPGDLGTSGGGDATSHDVTIRRCLIAEGLMHSTHPKSAHPMGSLIHDGDRNVNYRNDADAIQRTSI